MDGDGRGVIVSDFLKKQLIQALNLSLRFVTQNFFSGN